MRVRWKEWAAVLAVGSMAGTAAAQEEGPKILETVVVSATRAPEPVSAIPGSVIVIEREEIERQLRLNSSPSAAIQKLIPGYGVSNQTISEASENFRGRDVQVLVDGVARNTPLRNVSRLLSGIDLNNVERIEVINGSSAAYGSGASGGIINVITRQASDKPVVTASAGLRGFTADLGDSLAPEFSAGFRGMAGPVDVVASLSATYTRDAFDGRGNLMPSDGMLGQGGYDHVDNYNGSVKVGKSFDARRIELSSNIVRLEQDPQYFTRFYANKAAEPNLSQPYTGRSVTDKSEYWRATYTDSDFALGNLDLNLSYSNVEKRFGFTLYDATYNNQVYYSGNPASPTDPNSQSVLLAKQLNAAATVVSPLDSLWSGMKLTWGGDLGHDDTTQELIDGRTIVAPAEQVNMAAFAQVDAPVTQRVRLRGGLRYERFDVDLDDFRRPAIYYGAVAAAANIKGGSFTYDALVYNLGAVVDITRGLELFGGVSQGYSLPDWGAFSRRAGVAALGTTADLSTLAPRAQKVTTYEVGFRGGTGSFDGSISAYVSESKDGTTFDSASNRISQQKERIYGLELAGRVDLSDQVAVGTTASWMEGKYDRDKDGDLERYLANNRISSPFKSTVYADWQPWKDISLRGEALYVAGRDIHDGGTRQLALPGMFTLNAIAAYDIGNGGVVSFGVENLLDAYDWNSAASATRNVPVAALGRVVALRYSHTW
ncbi:MAG: TonB-dependent receptor [Ferrovibrio sp.]|uniref:TonB-dependent receptor n=1 Tax=Ferrovibrio sp. TaxID=1917215 RepID=UPI00391ABACB